MTVTAPLTTDEQAVWNDALERHHSLWPRSDTDDALEQSHQRVAVRFADQAVDHFRETQQRELVACGLHVQRLADRRQQFHVNALLRRTQRAESKVRLVSQQLLDLISKAHRRTVGPRS